MSRRATAMLSLIFVMGIWGSAFSVTKAAIAEVPLVLIAFLRFALAAAILLPLTRFRRAPSPRMAKQQWGWVAAMGMCGFTLFQAGSNIAQTYTTATQAAIILQHRLWCAVPPSAGADRVGRPRSGMSTPSHVAAMHLRRSMVDS